MDLKGRSFLKLLDFTPEEIVYLVDLAQDLKEKRKKGIRGNSLKDKNIALIFEKPSTRTRCSFTIGAQEEGALATYLAGSELQLGEKESIEDTARVLGRMFDGIEYRGFDHSYVEELAELERTDRSVAPDTAVSNNADTERALRIPEGIEGSVSWRWT